MIYEESKLIIEEINKTNNILINCHVGPDPDSIGSALALYEVLKKMGKNVEIICPSNYLYENITYLDGYKIIQKGVDFSLFDFSKFGLFITLDSSSWDRVTGSINIRIPEMRIIVIDHHLSNSKFGNINLVDDKATSVGEMLYKIFKDINVGIDGEIANYLMVAIVGDTGAFRFPNSTAETFLMTADLINKGADKDKIIHNIYRNEDINMIKFYGEVLTNLKLDKKGKFIWSALPYKVFEKFGKPKSARESAASLFFQIVDGTDFGFLAVEEIEGILSVSFRSRTGLDTSKIALKLGGGGHVYASGAKIKNLPFKEAVEKLLSTVRECVD